MDRREAWLKAYGELIGTLTDLGLPEVAAKTIAGNLGSEKALRRMAGYIRNARPRSFEQIVDEMYAIMEEQDAWRRKKQAEESNARISAWLDSEERKRFDE